MSIVKFILSFLSPTAAQESPRIPVIKDPIKPAAAPCGDLNAILLASAEAEVERLRHQVLDLEKNLNRLADELEFLQGDLVMANNWLAAALLRANSESRRADAYKAIIASQVARKSSKFSLPDVAPELTEEELNWRRRRAAARFEALFEGYEYDVKPEKKKMSVDKTDKRGHRNGTTTMSQRGLFYYLNR